MIYLDYAANTPVDDRVLNVFVKATKKYIANPNSNHTLGRLAKNEIDKTSKKIGDYFNTSKESVIYTSGSSESNNLVIKGIAEMRRHLGNKIIISSIEHSSVVAPCNYLANQGFDISVIPLTKEGMVDLNALEKELDSNTILVSICAVDSELGTIQPINNIATMVKKYSNAVFHTDATQAIGKVKLNYEDIDFISFGPHKFFGLNGIAVLINKNNIKLSPLIHGGKSTTIYRSGTPVTASIVALGKAFELAIKELDKRYNHIIKLNKLLREELEKIDYVHINSPLKKAIPNTLNISLIAKDTKGLLKQLEKNEIFLSTTTACSLKNTPSKSVLAITGDYNLASNSIRISLSHLTTKNDIKMFLNVFKKYLK